jgi:anti-sigma regulatory factor (Ser/Thr protein kinase)
MTSPRRTRVTQLGTMLVNQPFLERDLPGLRRSVAAHAGAVPLPTDRVGDLVLIASELAANAIRYGGGGGRLRLWSTSNAIHCRVSDDGPGLPDHYRIPGQRPEPTALGGRGLWLVAHYADTVHLAQGISGGTIVTATVNLPDGTTEG